MLRAGAPAPAEVAVHRRHVVARLDQLDLQRRRRWRAPPSCAVVRSDRESGSSRSARAGCKTMGRRRARRSNSASRLRCPALRSRVGGCSPERMLMSVTSVSFDELVGEPGRGGWDERNRDERGQQRNQERHAAGNDAMEREIGDTRHHVQAHAHRRCQRPIIRFNTTTTPRCTGSTPAGHQRRRDDRREERIAAIDSMIMPTPSSSRFTISSSTSGSFDSPAGIRRRASAPGRS